MADHDNDEYATVAPTEIEKFQTPVIFQEDMNSFQSIRLLLDVANKGEASLAFLRGYQFGGGLGAGGMGAVGLIEHEHSKDQLALKVMLPRKAVNAKAKDNFVREMNNAAALHHPNVVTLKASGSWNEIFFFTMEYCPLGSVSDLVRNRGRLEPAEASRLILQALEGLDYSNHAEIPHVELEDGSIGKGHGLVHRDIKPENILLGGSEQAYVAKLADYGLAKAFEFAGLSGQTMTGERGGTLLCMPRQQLVNYKRARPEVDVWAMAACFYFMLTGKYPRDFPKKAGSPYESFTIIETTAPVPIRQRGVPIPDRLADLLDQAVDDTRRHLHFQSVAAFKHALEQIL